MVPVVMTMTVVVALVVVSDGDVIFTAEKTNVSLSSPFGINITGVL